jgi:hypothetical protein
MTMNGRHLFALVLCGMISAPSVARAQIPNIIDPVKKAQNARDAENKRLSEQTGQAIKAPTNATRVEKAAAAQNQAAKPAAGQPKSGPQAQAPKSGPGATAATSAAAGASALPAGFQPVTREVYTYDSGGRRDPFFSLILTEDLRPLISDLKLTGILYDVRGKSVALMRDLVTNAQYRVTTGMQLGRMRVVQIKPRAVLFSINEFGLNRTDSLFMADTSQTRIR